MFFLNWNTKGAVPSPAPSQMVKDQSVKLSIASTSPDGNHSSSAEVMRVSATELRLALPAAPDDAFVAGLQLNARLDVVLPIPGSRPPVVTRTRVVGIAQNYEPGLPSMVVDVQFMDLSEDEERAIRDSHPGLLVS